jgi:hypothetical protein
VLGHCEVVFGLNFAVYSGTASVFSDMTNAVDGTGFQLKQTISGTLGPNRLPGVRLKACDVSITVIIFVPIKLSINMLDEKLTSMISTVSNPPFTAASPNFNSKQLFWSISSLCVVENRQQSHLYVDHIVPHTTCVPSRLCLPNPRKRDCRYSVATS